MKAEAKMAAPMKIEKNLNNYAFIGEFSQIMGKWPNPPLLLYQYQTLKVKKKKKIK